MTLHYTEIVASRVQMEKDDEGYLKVNKGGFGVFSLKTIEMIFILLTQ